MIRSLILVVLFSLNSAMAFAEGTVIGMRSGDHPGFGRLVFDLPPGTKASVTQGDGQVVVAFDPPGEIAGGARPPRNVKKVSLTSGRAEIALAPEAVVRSATLGTRFVLDLADAASPAPLAPAAPRQANRPTLPKMVEPVRPPTKEVHPDRALLSATESHWPDDEKPGPPQSPVPSPAAVPVSPPPAMIPVAAPPVEPPVKRDPPPTLKLAAAPSEAVQRPSERTILIPFDPTVAAASFRRGDDAVVVFDQRRPIDLAGLRGDRAFAGANVTLLPNGTMLRLPIARDEELGVARASEGWKLTIRPGADFPRPAAFDVQRADGALRFVANGTGGVVSVPDSETGAALLVGTVREAGQANVTARRTPEFAMPPTWLGLVIDPISDRVGLRATGAGFVVSAQPDGQLVIGDERFVAAATADARHFTRRFDFPDLPMEASLRRLQAAQAASAAASPTQRGERRRDVAAAMISLGLGAEAQAVLTISGGDDGRMANDPDRVGLQAIAAMMAGRPAEAGGIEDPRLDGNDEVNFWRAYRKAMLTEGAPAAASVLAANLPLFMAYPDAIRARMLPLVVETLAAGGEIAAAKRVVDGFPDTASLDLARARVAQGTPGADRAAVHAAFDKAANSPDRLMRARGAVGAVEARLRDGVVGPQQAADALDKLLYAWRGDERERALRMRVAALRAEAGQWRPALAMLRETEQLFPDDAAPLHAQLRSTFLSALQSDASRPLAPLDMVTLAEENADLLPDGTAGQAVAARIADRLTELDLPKRAGGILEKLLGSTPSGLAKAEIGSRLAAMREQAGDHAGALAALSASETEEVTSALASDRTMVFARAAAGLGDIASATAALAQLDSPAALELRADLLERRKDWRGATASLRTLVERVVPPGGVLGESEARLVLRLATAAAQAGDDGVLAAIRERDSSRFPKGKLADMLALLTGKPVQGVADLARSAQETKLARSFPTALRSLTP